MMTVTVVMNSWYVNTPEMVRETVKEWNSVNPQSPVTHIANLDLKTIPVSEYLGSK
jgi:hypothetical protein